MKKTMTREVLELLMGQLCKKCNEQVHMVPDTDQPTKVFKSPWGEGGLITSTISHPLKPHESGLCYFHLKAAENYFEAKFPLKGKVEEMGEGGLSACPSSIFISYGYVKSSKKRGRPASLR